MNTVHEERHRDHTIRILYDIDAENPREWENNLGTMTCWHSRYRLGDCHDHETPRDFLAALAGMDDAGDQSIDRLLTRAERNAVILPLYVYEHSGITINTSGFSCPWDSGPVGYVHAELAAIREDHGCKKRVSPALRRKVEDQLRNEVAVYDDYLTGNCFGYVVEKDGDQVDACWGFIGDYEDCCLQEARLAVPEI